MTEHANPSAQLPPGLEQESPFEVRSVTGACYTLVEETELRDGVIQRSFRTAYARLPVVANDDGSFTIVDTRTRLVRVR